MTDDAKPCAACGRMMYRVRRSHAYWATRKACSQRCSGVLRTTRCEYKKTVEDGRRRPYRRVLMERHIGRRLEEWEYVHHRNRNKHDNRLENLEVMDSRTHGRHHHLRLPLTKECVICGRAFTPHKTKRRRQQTCGPLCKGVLLSQRNRENGNNPYASTLKARERAPLPS